MKYIKLIVLLIVILTTSSIAFTQTSSDSLKCFTYKQLKEITKELKRANLCDSINEIQHLQINSYKSILDKDSKEIALNNEMIKKQKNKIKIIGIKLKISKRLTFIGTPVALLGGFLVGAMIK
tara:strand:+ start:1824 stop:2192 length:369 start_codon:yes stop_codon:yes gene_type:complete